jgi:hypothetical protein
VAFGKTRDTVPFQELRVGLQKMLFWLGVAGLCVVSVTPLWAIEAVALANSDPAYVQLRNLGLSGEAVAVSNLTLKRDAATFSFAVGDGLLCNAGAGEGDWGGVCGGREYDFGSTAGDGAQEFEAADEER